MAVANRKEKRDKRHFRARKKISGTTERPRLAIYRSNKHIAAQLVNDENSETICAVASYSKDFKGRINGSDKSGAEAIGKAIAEKAKAKGVEKVVFDCGGNIYHGRVQALADAARKVGLDF